VNAAGMGAASRSACCARSVREILGAGTLFGLTCSVRTSSRGWYAAAPGGFFVLGMWLLLFGWLREATPPDPQRSSVHGH